MVKKIRKKKIEEMTKSEEMQTLKEARQALNRKMEAYGQAVDEAQGSARDLLKLWKSYYLAADTFDNVVKQNKPPQEQEEAWELCNKAHHAFINGLDAHEEFVMRLALVQNERIDALDSYFNLANDLAEKRETVHSGKTN